MAFVYKKGNGWSEGVTKEGREEARDTSGSVWSVFSRHPLRVQTRVNPQWKFNGLEDFNCPMSNMIVCACLSQLWTIFLPFCMATVDEY